MIGSNKMEVCEFLEEGRKYHKTAVNGFRNRPEIFNSEIIYNLLALAIEKYFMAYLIAHGDIADNHTFSDLLSSYQRTETFPKELADRLLALEKLQDLCPAVKAFSVTVLTVDEINEMIEVTGLVCEVLGYSNPLLCCEKDC